MNFTWALEHMNKGHRVRRRIWVTMPRCQDEGRYIMIESKYMHNHKGYEVTISHAELMADDWEFYIEEKKELNLSDEIQGSSYSTSQYIKLESAQECIKKIRELISDSKVLTEKLDKIVGDKFR